MTTSPALEPRPLAALRLRWPARWSWPLAYGLIVLAIAGVLAELCATNYRQNERRLLGLRARDAGQVLSGITPELETPLATAAALADATGGSVTRFRALVGGEVGAAHAHPFVSVSLWRLTRRGPELLTDAGVRPELAPADVGRAIATAGARRLFVVDLTAGHPPRLGYLYEMSDRAGGYAVYAEAGLPHDRRASIAANSAFRGLHYAIFLDTARAPRSLLASDLSHLPLPGAQQSVVVPFGSARMTLTMSSATSLEGGLARDLPWFVLGVGLILAAGVALVARSLEHRRLGAEALAGRLERVARENERLYAEQRGIAETLQHALLPDRMPEVAGIAAEAVYRAGERGMEIGGDWYDVVDLGAGRLLLVVGDVSGRGLRAATTMASLRYAIRAYAADGADPGAILTKLKGLLDVSTAGQLATVLCALIEVEERRITLASAGHLPPLVVDADGRRFLRAPVGVPVGVRSDGAYPMTTVSAGPGATLIAFTDGLVERRGEVLDAGLERLAGDLDGLEGSLADILAGLLAKRAEAASLDDVALVGLRWTA